MNLVDKYQSCTSYELVPVPSELIWLISLKMKLEEEFKISYEEKCTDWYERNKNNTFIELDSITKGDSFSHYRVQEENRIISHALGRLIDRYDVPKHWFDSLVRYSETESFVDYIQPDKSRETRRRKTWINMQRDITIFIYSLQGKKASEIGALLLQNGFHDSPDIGNIKKIIRDVRYRKLGIGLTRIPTVTYIFDGLFKAYPIDF
jgi:hypothetical protein